MINKNDRVKGAFIMVKVSIIVPIYKVEKYLKRCLESLVSQTFQEIEIICVNDGSPDQSQKIVDEYVEKYPEIVKGYVKENGGVGDTRNYGLDCATGEYIAFVDSDDWVEPEMIEKMYRAAIEQKADLVICDYVVDNIDGGSEMIISGIIKSSTDIFKRVLISPPAPWNKLYKKDLFLKNEIRYPKGLWYEDLATTPRLLMNVHKISHINEALVHYIQREGSIMATLNEKVLDIYKSLGVIEEYYKSHGLYQQYKEEIEYLYVQHLISTGLYNWRRFKNGEQYLKKAIAYMNDKFPKWYENVYVKQSSKKEKLALKLVYNQQLTLLKIILFINDQTVKKLR